MGVNKNRHSKDKLYLLPSELTLSESAKPNRRPSEILALDSCSLSLAPFVEPVCTPQGHVFDKENIINYLEKHGRNPVTFEPLAVDDLFPLHFSREENGELQCPLTYKRFTPTSRVVAVRPSGNVYGAATLKQVAKRQANGHMQDPLTGQDFTRADVITLQDPENNENRTIGNFKHIPETFATGDGNAMATTNINDKTTCKTVLEKLQDYKEMTNEHARLFKAKSENDEAKVASPAQHKHKLYTSADAGSCQSASFTCTALDPCYKTNYRNETFLETREPLYLAVKKAKQKAYVKLVTSDGDLNIMLHADRVPLTCDNFLLHCHDGYYNDTIFHRCVKNFMIQGGDPSGTGMGGVSAFYSRMVAQAKQDDSVVVSNSNDYHEPSKYFKDEIDNTLFHVGPGVVSMANKGKNTNASQFFITFDTCSHLDKIHTVFGKVVGGKQLLEKWSNLKTDEDERPLNPPKIIATIICSDPFQEAQVQIEDSKVAKKQKATTSASQRWLLADL